MDNGDFEPPEGCPVWENVARASVAIQGDTRKHSSWTKANRNCHISCG
jgi:hypothetical protein